jgi:DHA1 family multidrug resistance protein-like MFS transporter
MAAATAPATQRGWAVNFGTLLLSQFSFHISLQFAMPFLAIYMRDLGATEQEAIALTGLMNTLSMGIMAVSQGLWGTLADRYGNKPMIIRGMLGNLLLFIGLASAQAPWHVFALRIFQGVGGGAVPAMQALGAVTLPASRFGMGMGLMQAAQSIPQSVGPLMGGLAVAAFGFRGSFSVAAVGMLVVAALVYFQVREPARQVKDRKRHSFKDGLAMVLRTRALLVPMLGMMFFQATYMASNQMMPLHVYSILEDDPSAAPTAVGSILASTALGATIGALSIGWLSNYIRGRHLAVVCMILCGLTLIPQYFFADVFHFVVIRFFLGFFAGGTLPTLRTVLGEQGQNNPESNGRLATLYGFAWSAQQGGQAFGIAGAALIASLFGIPSVYVAFGVLLVIVGLSWAYATRGREWVAARETGAG